MMVTEAIAGLRLYMIANLSLLYFSFIFLIPKILCTEYVRRVAVKTKAR